MKEARIEIGSRKPSNIFPVFFFFFFSNMCLEHINHWFRHLLRRFLFFSSFTVSFLHSVTSINIRNAPFYAFFLMPKVLPVDRGTLSARQTRGDPSFTPKKSLGVRKAKERAVTFLFLSLIFHFYIIYFSQYIYYCHPHKYSISKNHLI